MHTELAFEKLGITLLFCDAMRRKGGLTQIVFYLHGGNKFEAFKAC